MAKILPVLIPALLGAGLFRLLLQPVCFAWKLLLHALCGFLCLWLLNLVSGITGLCFPVNALTVLLAGFLGLPGVGLMALLELMG